MSATPPPDLLEAEGPRYQILHEEDASSRLQEVLLEGEEAQVDVVVITPDKETRFTVRLQHIKAEPIGEGGNLWLINDAVCTRIGTNGQPVGPQGTCNGWFSTTHNPGAIAGELQILFNPQKEATP